MDINTKVAIIRFKYHASMVSLCNVANQLKLLSDERTDRACRHHVIEIIDCVNRIDNNRSSLQ